MYFSSLLMYDLGYFYVLCHIAVVCFITSHHIIGKAKNYNKISYPSCKNEEDMSTAETMVRNNQIAIVLFYLLHHHYNSA